MGSGCTGEWVLRWCNASLRDSLHYIPHATCSCCFLPNTTHHATSRFHRSTTTPPQPPHPIPRVWSLGKDKRSLVASMKEHKGAVMSIAMRNSSDEECASAAADGSCIIWDLATMKRRIALQANTVFRGVAYHPDDSQLVTCGTDRKVTYWDNFDGQPIRIIDGSDSSEVTSICTDAQGVLLVTGGGDKLVRVWHYDDGTCTHKGQGHSGTVTRVLVAPDRSRVVSVGEEGGVFVWDTPGAATEEGR